MTVHMELCHFYIALEMSAKAMVFRVCTTLSQCLFAKTGYAAGY